MAAKARVSRTGLLVAATWAYLCAVAASAFDVPTVAFEERFSPLFGDGNLVRSSDDRSVRLLLDRRSGSGFVSSDYYLHGFFSASIKLPKDYTAGVVVAFYLSNGDVYEKTHDELDFEFLGSRWGGQWRVQTNVYGNGSTSHGREERYLLPFDPTLEAHSYSVLWAPTLLHRRHADPGGDPAPGHGRRLPGEADGGVRHHLGRLRVGHGGGQVQGQLQVRAVRVRLLRAGHRRLPRRPGAPRPAPPRRPPGPPRAHDGRLRRHDAAEARGHARLQGAADDVHGVLRRRAVRGRAVPGVRQLGRGEGVLLRLGRVQDRRHEAPRPRPPPGTQGRRQGTG